MEYGADPSVGCTKENNETVLHIVLESPEMKKCKNLCELFPSEVSWVFFVAFLVAINIGCRFNMF